VFKTLEIDSVRMNPLARGIHKNVESKSYQRVSNDIRNETIEAADHQQCRSRLGRLKQAISKPLGSSSNTSKVTENDSDKASPPTWNGEFPTEVIGQNVEKPYRNDVRTAMSKSGGVSILSYADSSDIVVEPTISRPSIQQRKHPTNHGMKGSATVTSYLSVESLDHVEPPSVSTISRPSMKIQQHPTIQSLKGSSTLHSPKSLHNADHLERPSNSGIGRHSIQQGQVVTNPNLKGSATVFSSQTIDSVDRVEKPSITTPSFHRGQANRMSSSKRMLSEKTINTINTQGTFNTYGTSGTENYTITTVDSTAPGSFVSLQSTTTASLAAALAHTADDSGYCDATDGYEYEMSLSDENSPSCRLSQANQETEEDLMIRMAMEMSLAEFKANGGKDSHHLQHDFPVDRFPVRNKGMQWNRQSSLHSVMTSITTEPTEVFIENNAGSQRNRVFTFPPSNEKPLLNWSPEGDTIDFTHSLDAETLRQLEFARANLPKEEADAIESAIRNSYSCEVATKKHEVTSFSQPVEESPLSVNASEAAEIEQAIKDADEHQERLSMEVAIKLQAAEEKGQNFQRSENESYDIMIDNGFHQDFKTTSGSNSLFASLTCQDEITEHDLDFNLFKSEWGDTILNFEADEDIDFADNSAYDVFKTNFHRPARAPSATENRTRDQIHQAIDTGLIGNCNGIVKKGDEAVVYHANEGAGSDGHDVAIKVFQRIKRIRSRTVGEGALCYFPRSFRDSFRDDESFTPEQLELLAEKEYANLIRAHHARVPVASPLLQQENLVFMRFMGEDGWPAPQLKDMELRVGSKTWSTLYFQVMVAVRR
jgi:RIO1 family